MAIREMPNGRWQACVSVRIPGTPQVKRITKMAPKGAGKRQARQLELEIRSELAAGKRRVTATKSSTLLELMHRWLADHAAHVAEQSAYEYRRRIKQWIEPHPIAKIRVDQLTTQHVDGHYARLTRHGLSPRSIQLVHANISAALDRAIAWDLIGRNVSQQARRPKIIENEVQVPSDEITAQLYEAAGKLSPSFQFWMHLAIVTGARRGEISGLKWSDIDLDLGTLRIIRTLGPRQHDGPPKTQRSTRTVHLDPATMDLVRAHWEAVIDLSAELKDDNPYDRWLFPHQDSMNGRIHRSYDWPHHQLRRAILLVPGSAGTKPHHLRHRAATALLAAGVTITDTAARIGNSPAVLMRTYAHSVDDHNRQTATAAHAALPTPTPKADRNAS
jgi:integrase